MKKLTEKWTEFFFKPMSPSTLGLYRIVFGFVVFLSNLGRFPGRDIFYGENAIVRPETVNPLFPHVPPWIFFRWMPTTEPGLAYFFIAIYVINFFFIFGLFSRVSAVLMWLGIMTMTNRNPYVENGGDTLLRCNLFFLMFADVGASYSLDRWIQIKRGIAKKTNKLISPWPVRMLQLQLAYVYVDTVYLKLPGKSWQDGTAMYYALNYIELWRFRPKFLFYYYWQVKLATYFTLIGETSVAAFIWFKRFRYWMIGLIFLLHGTINLVMQFPAFQYIMMSSALIFIYPEDTERVVSGALLWIRRCTAAKPLNFMSKT